MAKKETAREKELGSMLKAEVVALCAKTETEKAAVETELKTAGQKISDAEKSIVQLNETVKSLKERNQELLERVLNFTERNSRFRLDIDNLRETVLQMRRRLDEKDRELAEAVARTKNPPRITFEGPAFAATLDYLGKNASETLGNSDVTVTTGLKKNGNGAISADLAASVRKIVESGECDPCPAKDGCPLQKLAEGDESVDLKKVREMVRRLHETKDLVRP
ncbi:hypothetical protein C4569_01030 [Candidatus Parcubacteria bacterium]|nr:MAG: hypothetical protein C4569_01030 [Candidatus Parcubacteria bacterium]